MPIPSSGLDVQSNTCRDGLGMSRHTCINILISINVVQGSPNLQSHQLSHCKTCISSRGTQRKQGTGSVPRPSSISPIPADFKTSAHDDTADDTRQKGLAIPDTWRRVHKNHPFPPLSLPLCLVPLSSLPLFRRLAAFPPRTPYFSGLSLPFVFLIARTSLQQSEVVGRRTCQEAQRGGG